MCRVTTKVISKPKFQIGALIGRCRFSILFQHLLDNGSVFSDLRAE